MQSMDDLLDKIFLGNPLSDWLLAAVVFVVTLLVIPALRNRLEAQARKLQGGSHAGGGATLLQLAAVLLGRTSKIVLLVVAVYLAQKMLTWSDRVHRVFDVIIVFGIWLQVGLWASASLRFLIEHRQRRDGVDRVASAASIDVVMFLAQLMIWAVILLVALDNLGVNITALVAGLGVGGIAIALAVQTVLGDVLGSLTIAFDKPFTVGDAVRIDDIEGTVEHVGIKSTRIRSVTGEQVVMANADMLKSRLRNLGRMPEKRVLSRLRIAYDTAPAQVEKVPVMAEEAVKAAEGTRFFSCLLMEIGQYSLEFELIYYVSTQEGRNVARSTDAVNRGILSRFATAGISFAYPTQQSLLIGRDGAAAAPAKA